MKVVNEILELQLHRGNEFVVAFFAALIVGSTVGFPIEHIKNFNTKNFEL